jgi:glycosyltransferase involved in cell wall biosynthesis
VDVVGIDISTIICTRNRAEYLAEAIQSQADQTLEKALYETIVVDNGSTDDTRTIVRQEFAHVPNLRYIYEPLLGLSRARNTGWKHARGTYVAYLDDDAIACSEWLERILHVFETVRPKPGCVGGKIKPIWGAGRPQWLSDKLAPILTIVDWSPRPIILSQNQWIAGANMAFPRGLLESIGGFDVTLGRKGNKLLSMEESLLRQRLEKKGYQCLYHPEIAVRHHIPGKRLKKGWFARRWYWQGVSDAIIRIRLESLTPLQRIQLAGFAANKLIAPPRRLISLATSTNDPDRFAKKCFTLLTIGYVLGLLAVAK